MQVSVLIVSWNARDWLARCLRSLATTPHPVVVVDNASGDGSADLVRRDFPITKLIASAENLGFAGGVNRARRAATGEALLLLNPDIEVEPGAIERLVQLLEADGEVGAVAGRLVDVGGTTQAGFNVRRFPTLASIAVDLLLVDHVWPGNPISTKYYARDVNLDSPGDVEQPAAACLLVRADAFDRLGGLDERFWPAWFEDVDFCRRLRQAGYRIRYDPSARFVHRGGVARDTLGHRGFSQTFYRNLLRYVRKHHGAAATVFVRGLLVLGMIPRAVVAAVRGNREGMNACGAVLLDAVSWRAT